MNNFNNITNADIFSAHVEKIKKVGILAHLKQTVTDNPEKCPDGKLPCGKSPEEAYKAIHETAAAYVGVRDDQSSETQATYSEDELKKTLASHTEDMTTEEAINYYALLITVNELFGIAYTNGTFAIEANDIQDRCNETIAKHKGENDVETLEALYNALDFSNPHTFVKTCEAFASEQRKNSEYTKIAADTLSTKFSTLDELENEVAAIYTCIILSDDADVSSALDPGFLTAQYAAYKDTQAISDLRASEQITEKEKTEMLGKVGNAFAKALAVALKILYWVCSLALTGVALKLAVALGVTNSFLLIILFAALLRHAHVVYTDSHYENIIDISTKFSVKHIRDSKFGIYIKNLWNKASEMVSNAVQSIKSRRETSRNNRTSAKA